MNALILAAGLGTRLRPLTDNIPKCMVKVNGEPIVERQIKFLKDKGINDITLISGYKSESLEYLRDKYGIELVRNPYYDKANNIYSLYIAQDRFCDSYVLEGDVYLMDNIIETHLEASTYFAKNKTYENEWGLVVDSDNALIDINIGNGEGYIMSGVSYWTRENCEKIKARINNLIDNDSYKDLFWDNAVIDLLPSLDPISVRGTDSLYEIDTVSDLYELERILKAQ